ncbi:hypothetical protein VL762_13455 [Flavobacterium psychrophilum]|uniref:hypothetical protein n=1 Tax=Flavobacterium psychrophilum TaxID=96345 RepID=UPI002C6C7143|nr:hypothetical protein [Flavobacterium psychrophilum]
MTKKQFYIILSVLLIAILIFSNPSEEVHIQSVKSKLKIAFKKKMSSEMSENQDDAFKTLGNGLGLLLGDTFIDKLTDGIVSRENYLLFSLTNANYKGDEKTIGFGILGNVFLTDKIENVFKENEDNEIKNYEKSESETNNESNDVTDEDFKNSLQSNNQNSDKYEFTADMLIDRNDSRINAFIENKDDYCYGEIRKFTNEINPQNNYHYADLTIKISKSNQYLIDEGYKNGDEILIDLDAEAIAFNGKSKMCETCAEDFKELLKVGRKIKFKTTITTGAGSSGGGALWGLIYVSKNE